jgi:hypothetical protein
MGAAYLPRHKVIFCIIYLKYMLGCWLEASRKILSCGHIFYFGPLDSGGHASDQCVLQICWCLTVGLACFNLKCMTLAAGFYVLLLVQKNQKDTDKRLHPFYRMVP